MITKARLISMTMISFTFFLISHHLLCQKISAVIQKGHGEVVKSAAFSRDGKYLITGSRDRTSKLWDVATGHEIRSYLGHNHTINQARFSNNGKFLATSSADNSVRIWATSFGRELFKIDGDQFKTAVAFSPDDKYLAVAGYERHMEIWNVADLKKVMSLKVSPEMGRGYGINLEFSPDGKWLFVGEDNQRAKIYATNNWQLKYDFPIEKGYCGGCIAFGAFDHESKLFFKLSNRGSLSQYDLLTGELIRTKKNKKSDISNITVSPDNESLLIASEKELIRMNIASWDTTWQFTPAVNGVNEANYSPDGQSIIVAGNNNKATLYSANDGMEIRVFEGILNNRDKGGLDFDPTNYWTSHIAKYVKLKNKIILTRNGESLIRGKLGSKARMWDINSGTPQKEFSGHEKAVLTMDISVSGETLLTGGGNGKAILWNLTKGDTIKSFKAHREILFETRFSHDNRLILTTSWDGTAKIWDSKNMEQLVGIDFGNTSAYSAAFSPNDLYLVVGKLDKTLEMWEIDTRSKVRSFVGHTNVVSTISYTKDGQLLTSSWDGSARLWDIASGLMVKKFKTDNALYTSIVTPDEKYIVTGGADRIIRFWDRNTGQIVKTLEGHQAGVATLNFTTNGKGLISSDLDGSTKFWNLENDKELFEHIIIGKNDWMIKTRDGYFTATDKAMKSIHFVHGMKSYEVEQFFDRFYRPDLMKSLFKESGNSKTNNLDGTLHSSPPPDLQLGGIKSDGGRSAELFIRVVDTGGGVRKLKFFQNGKRLQLSEKSLSEEKKLGDTIFYRHKLPLVVGKNTFEVAASSRGNIESKRASVEIVTDKGTSAATCYIFVVGINEYLNQKLQLNYAKADAQAIAQSFEAHSKSLFDKIEVHALYDQDAHKDGILSKLDELAQKATLQDVFIFYYAGHGSMVDQNFYFVPVENARLYDARSLEKNGVKADVFQEKLEKIKALKQIIIMDACQSGGSVELLAKRDGQRGALEEKAIAQLSRSSGIHVLAAAGSDQFATEFEHLGHGLFTYVLLEALSGKADGAPKDGKVTIYELKSYLDDQVPEYSQKHKGKPQYPFTFSRGNDFPLVIRQN